VSKKDQEKARKRLDRGRADLERSINSAILSEGSILNQPEDLGRTTVVDPQEVVEIQRGATYARPSAADRIEEIINEVPSASYPSLADRAERQARQFRAQAQGEMDPALADRAEREINRQMADLVTPEERVRYSPAAVARLNAEEDALAAAVNAPEPTTEQRGEQPLAGGMFSIDTGLNAYIAEQRAQQTVNQPAVESLKGETERKSFVIENYPTLMAAADRAGLSDDEVRDMVNFTLAFDAARLVGEAISDDRRAAIFATMSRPMQALVRDIVMAGIEEDKARGDQPPDFAARVAEAQQSGREAVAEATGGLAPPIAEYIGGAVSKAIEQQNIIGQQSTGNTGQDVLRTAWNWSLGPAFDAWFASAENVQRGFRAANLALGTELGEYSWEQAWQAAEKNQFSQSRLNELREIYGAKSVDIVVEVMTSRFNNDPDLIGTIIQKYQNDPEAMDFIDKAINGVRNDQEMADLITSVRAAQTGDTGNVLAQASLQGEGIFAPVVPYLGEGGREIGQYEQTALYSIFRNATNVASIFFLDPLLLAGAARGGVLAARYGMARVALEANVPVKGMTVFREPNVRTFLGTMGRQLQDVNRLETEQGVAAMAPANASVRSMYKRYFNGNALDDMRIFLKDRPDADPAAALEEYFSNIENLQHIIVGQSAKRGRQVQVPHMTAATARVKLMSMKLRGLTYQNTGTREFLDNVFYNGFTSSLPAQAADDFARIISGPDGDKYVGRALSDFTIRDGEMVRNLMGRVVLDRLPKQWGFTQRYGWKRSHTPAAIAARARRMAAIWPDASKPLKVSDGSDAERVQRLVEAAGMPRHFSLIVREMWANADEPTRRLMGEGLARSYGYARGVDVVSPEGKALLDQIGPGAARGDQYASSLPDLPAMQNEARMIAQRRIDESGIGQTVDQTVLDQYALLYDDVVREAEEVARREGKTIEEMSLGAGDDLAAKIINQRAQTLLDENPELLDSGIFRGPSGFVIDTSNSKVKSLYLKEFYPDLKPSTRITLYRAVQEGEIPGIARGTTGPAAGRIEPGGGSWWTTNPLVAARFAQTSQGRKIAVLNVSWDELQKIDSTFVPGPRTGGYGLDDEVIIDFTSDAFKAVSDRVSILDELNVPNPSNLNALAAIKQVSLDKPAVSVDDLAEEILQNEIILTAGQRNPSMINGTPGAIVLSDTTDFMAFPDINKLERFTARSSLLTALTGQNVGMSNATDLWVLGTLAGPRFQVRNAIEDMGLYILTTGSLRGYFKGRKISAARREAQARDVTKPFQPIKGMQLGMIKTASRNVGSLFSDEMASIILPNLSKRDIARANALAKNGDREALAKLVAKAYLRQRLTFLPGRHALIGRSIDEAKLSADQLKELRWIEQAIEHGDVLRAMDEAAETGRHLADGFPARAGDMSDPLMFDILGDDDIVMVGGQAFRVNRYDVKYEDRQIIPGSNESMKAWRHNLGKIVHGDGPKGQWTMELLPRYFAALAGGRTQEAKNIVDELAERIANADPKFGYGDKFMIQRVGGFEALAQASLDNAYQLFMTNNGKFNRALYRKMSVKNTLDDGTEETVYALWGVTDDGGKTHLVSINDLSRIALTKGHPLMVNARVSTEVLTPLKNNQWTSTAWQMMGRSLARMTREPIFMANYLDARGIMAPFEAKLTETIGKRAAEKWAVDAATERAYRLTMNYVDNPNVRSQFAWQIRNVARFYRALEDFNRRMIRTARNEPMAFARLALAWNALDDSGFVWEDEFGEKYFVWPGTRQGFEAINGILNMLGQQVYSPGLPLAFTSRVNMLTPSADPNALLPTFSGPYAAFAVMPLMRALPGLRRLENEFFGEYTQNRSVLETVFPSHVNRVINFIASQRGTTESRLNETDSIFANSARSAVQAYAAAGLWDPSKSYTAEEQAEHQQRIDRTAQWILGLKLILSPVLPAAFSTNVDTATDFAKTLGIDGMRPAFVQVLRANEGDISAASIQWLKMNPDLSPFMVGTTKSPESKGYYGPFEETVDWIQSNEEALKLSVEGASYFAPIDGTQTLASWSFLMANGFKARESTKNYMNEVLTSEGKTLYYNLRSQWVDRKKNGDPDADAKWDAAKEDLYARYPMLRSAISGELATTTRSSIDDMIAQVDGIRKVAEYYNSEGKLDERGKGIYDLVSLRDQAAGRLQGLNDRAPNYTKERDKISERWKNVMEAYSQLYPDDRQWRNLLYVLSESLVQGWGRYV
jgi:hypothetical protein